MRAALGWLAVVVAAFLLGGLAIVSPVLVVGLLAAVALVLLLTRPTAAAVLAVTVVPFQQDVAPGGGLNLSASDLLIVTAIVGWVIQQAAGHGRQLDGGGAALPARAVRPLAAGLLAYAATAGVSLVVHPSGVGLLTAVQRAEIVVGGLIVGGGLVRTGRLRPALTGFLLASAVLALAALAASGSNAILGIQKNPAGGFLVTALVVAFVLRPTRWWVVLAPLFAVGAVATQSRGALVGLGVAAVVTVLVVRLRERWRLLAGLAGGAALVYLMYLNLPAEAKTRLLDTSGSTDKAIEYRQQFQADAFDAFRQHPWTGVGVGNYRGGPRLPGILDPHNVLYLTLAEGGVLLVGGLGALTLLTAWVCVRRLGRTRLAVAALAVQIATVVHALADVYWVRGTPTPAYLLLGALLAVTAYADAGDHRADEWLRGTRVRLSADAPELGAREDDGVRAS